MEEKVLQILVEKLKTPVELVTDKDECGAWDSVTHLEIIMELEQAFNVRIPLEDMPKLTSGKEIVEWLSRRKS